MRKSTQEHVPENTEPDRRPTPFYTARRQYTLPGREDRHPRGADLFPSRLLIAFSLHTTSCQSLREETYNLIPPSRIASQSASNTRRMPVQLQPEKYTSNDHHHSPAHPQRETRRSPLSFIATRTHLSAHAKPGHTPPPMAESSR
jgi:hypothetical protein